MTQPTDTLLGQPVAYSGHYDASRLQPIAREPQRQALGLAEPLPFMGVDIWNAYEFSWLDARGKPRVAMVEFRVPATSPHLIDELYDRHVNLVCTAAAAPPGLYTGHRLVGAFERTASRLIEMRSAEYLALEHRG